MKRIEIYLDESGEIQEVGRPMNVTGIVTVAPNDGASDQFHRWLYSKVSNADLLAGFCDGGSIKITRTATPHLHLPKRPQNGELAEHKANILKFIGHANDTAKETGVELGAFSLVFPCNAKKPWHSPAGWVDQLLDRSYLERVKDALELLFFECPWLLAHLHSECEVALDLPTRSVSSVFPDEYDLNSSKKILWDYWGIKSDAGGPRKLRVCSLAPADGSEILTSVLSRRHRSMPDTVKILGARCVRLMDWESWDRDCGNAGARNNWKQKYLAPKQVHYLADLLANSVYRNNPGSEVHKDSSVKDWFTRGYFLNAGKVDPWISASRMFANGDRLGALRMLFKRNAAINCGQLADFFRARSKAWFLQLGGGDLRSLFLEGHPIMRSNTPSNSCPPVSEPVTAKELKTKSIQANSKPEILNLLPRPMAPSPSIQSVIVRWRVLLELPSSWTSQSLMEAIQEAKHQPEPLCIRRFLKDDSIEFLLDVRSSEDVRSWVDSPVVISGVTVTAKDSTLPENQRVIYSKLD